MLDHDESFNTHTDSENAFTFVIDCCYFYGNFKLDLNFKLNPTASGRDSDRATVTQARPGGV
jgi:hypothetical protein